jgi:hypothetical protein
MYGLIFIVGDAIPPVMNTLLLSLVLSQSPTPLLAAEPATVDRGNVKSGTVLSHTVELKNHSRGLLSITDVSGSCGCLHPRLSSKSILPGESSKLAFEVNTLSQAGGPAIWKATVRYQVESAEEGNLPASGQIEVSIKANVIREINVEPVAIALTGDGELVHTITVTDRRQQPLTITTTRTDLKHVTIQPYQPVVDAKGQRIQRIRVTVAETCPAGHFSDTLRLFSNDLDYPELAIPIQISRRAKGEVICNPDQMTFRLADGQTSASGLIRLRDPDDNALVVEKIEADSPVIQSKWVAGPGSMVTVRITADLSKERKSGSGTLTIHVRDPKPQVIAVPVSWLVP